MTRRHSIDQQSSIKPSPRFTELGQLPISMPIGGHELTILYWGFFEPSFWRNYLHTHSFYEINYIYCSTTSGR